MSSATNFVIEFIFSIASFLFIARFMLQEAERRLKALQNPIRRPRQLKFKLHTRQRGGNIVLRTSGVAVGYPGKQVFFGRVLLMLDKLSGADKQYKTIIVQ